MKVQIAVLLLVLAAAVPGHAQTRITESVNIGLEQGLGFTEPTVGFSTGVEHPFGNRFELDAMGEFSISHKVAEQPFPNGHSIILTATPIFWWKPWLGVTGTVECNWLFTIAYDKHACPEIPKPGVVFRTHPLGLPSRLWLDAVIPTGSIDRKTGIESNRTAGVEFAWEARMWRMGPIGTRLEFNISVYHGYNQGNPQCDGTDPGPVTCPRSSWLTYTDVTTLKFEFPMHKGDDGRLW